MPASHGRHLFPPPEGQTATQGHIGRGSGTPLRDPWHVIGCGRQPIVWGALGSINWEQPLGPFFSGGLASEQPRLHHFKTCTERLNWPILISCMQTSKFFEFKCASARSHPRQFLALLSTVPTINQRLLHLSVNKLCLSTIALQVMPLSGNSCSKNP